MNWVAYEPKFRYNLKGLQLYQEIYVILLVPSGFIVPSTKEWPEEYWGVRLGRIVNHLRFVKEKVKNCLLRATESYGFHLD